MNLAEDAWLVLIVGGLAAVLLAVAFRQTGQRSFAVGAVIALVATLLCWLFEWLVVTEREQVALTVQTAAGHLKADRDAELMAMIAPDADELRALAETYVPRFGKAEVSMSDMKVEISEAVAPPMATVEVIARITLIEPTPDTIYTTIGPVPLVIRLQKYNDRWLLVGCRRSGNGTAPWRR